MPSLNQQILGTLRIGGGGLATNYPGIAAGTPIYGVIYPFPGKDAGNFVQRPFAPNVQFGVGISHVTSVIYSNGSTLHNVVIARPFNRTHLTKTILPNTGTASGAVQLAVDPGVYSTSYKYPCPGGIPGLVADNAISANDIVCIQMDDGSWYLMTIGAGAWAVNNGSTLTLTTALPNLGVGASLGNAVYFYGSVIGATPDKNPATGIVNPNSNFTSAARATWQELQSGIVAAFNPGDPLVIYSLNNVATGNFDAVAGFYSVVA